MINIKIDGKVYTEEKGMTILEVAAKNGISIPTLCYSKSISKTTSCFVCVVKDVKTGRFLPSCSASADDGMEIESSSAEVMNMRQTAFNLLLSEHSGDCEAPCTIACPAHALVEEYVREGKKGNHLEGLKIIKERIPLPMSIGRVCPRFCEKDCRRNVTDKDQPVAINDFKRIAADLHYESYMEELPALGKKKVAIIGAGPAGLSVAYFLRKNGIASDLFDKMPHAGGMLRYGIPEYRLPKAILDKEIAHFGKMGGINILCNKELGKDITLDELKSKYDAVAVTIGSWKSSSMGAEGDELAEGGIQFLEKIALNGWKGANPGKTIVVGGGNTAMDCLRTSVRLGSKDVSCYYRRTLAEMPAEKIEIHEAKEEGVKFELLTAPVKIVAKGNKKVITFQRMELGEPDASGRRKPVPVKGSEFEVEADTVIAAIGQKTHAPAGVKANKWGDVDVNKANLNMDGKVFSAGDCVSGPATVVEAVAGARKAALAIVSYLDSREFSEPYILNVTRGKWQHLRKDNLVFLKEPVARARAEQSLISVIERQTTFKEVAYTFTDAQIKQEGERCFECSCTTKTDCKLKEQCETYGAKPDAMVGEKLNFGYDTRHPDIIMDRGKCVKCGICVKVCKDVVNKSLLGFKFRGFFTKVETGFNQPLPAYCKDCGKCIEECPVGALDWKNK